MAKQRPSVEFYFDFSCPYAYVASARIEAVCAACDAALTWRPMLLGGVFRGVGAADSPMTHMGPGKARHNFLDMHRWARYYGVPLTMPPGHPMRTVRALRALLSLPEPAWPPVIHAIYRAYWQHGRDITAPDALRAVLADAGVDAPTIDRAIAANDDDAIKQALRERTDQAIGRGVFGAPTMFVHGPSTDEPVMLWGQDRLHMAREVLRGWIPGHGKPTSFAPLDAAVAAPAEDTAIAAPADDTAIATPADESSERPVVHFWYDFSSPFAYLGATQIERVAARAGAELVWRPMLLGAVFKQIDTPNVPLLAMPEAKRAWVSRDLDHWASLWDVPFRFATRFPMKTVTALRLALLAGDQIAPLSHALFRVLWVEDGDLNDRDTLVRVLTEHGLDADDLLARTRDPAVKQRLIDNTAEAVASGVFGAPTAIIQSGSPTIDPTLLYWGQDRLDLVAAALRGWRPELPAVT